MRSKHSYLEHLICLKRIKRGYLQGEEDVERKAKTKIMVVMQMEGRKNKQFDKSKVKCYNCQRLGHFSDECELPKKDKSKVKEKMHLAQEDEEEESSLLMVQVDELADVLLQGMNGSPINDMWYLDTGANNHMTGMKTFYQSLDESHKGVVTFGDDSSIRYEGKGEVHMECTNGEQMIFENVLDIHKLKTNILSLGKLGSQGCDIRLRDGFPPFMM